VNYDATNWKRIATILNSENYDKIALPNRAQIVNDALYMVTTKQLDIVTYLEIINYLWREVDPIAWNPIFDHLINQFSHFIRVSAVVQVQCDLPSLRP
jgi:hypothetical protein